MLPIKAVRLAIGDLLASDVATFAPVAANKIALVASAFVEDENVTLASLTLATFTGSTPKAGAAGAQQVGVDPGTLDQIITNLAPAGGWRWECTAAPAVAEMIFGFILTDNAGAVLVALELFDTPVLIANVGDFIDLGAVTLRLVAQPVS